MIFLSPAKVNLTLYIKGKDKKDGYHYIDSIIDPVSLYDLINVNVSEKKKIIIKDKLNKLKIPASKNLIYKAAKLLQARYNVKKGAIIEFFKYIPDGSGLGGGSSNAATILKALNKLWNLKLSYKKLEKIAIKIGSDVPFFIKSGFGKITGKGDKIKVFKRKKNNWYVIVVPKNCKVKTSLAYKWYDEDFVLTKIKTCYKINSDKYLQNDLENPVLNRKPLLRNIKRIMTKIVKDEKKVSLSGSGSAFFSLCETKNKAKYIFNELKGALINCKIYLVHSA